MVTPTSALASGPSVVNISAERVVRRRTSPAEQFWGAPRESGRRSESLGSGVILDASGIVVTNDHVVSGASKIYVTTADGERSVGQIPDVSEQEALAFYTRRFEALELEVSLLERRIASGASRNHHGAPTNTVG